MTDPDDDSRIGAYAPPTDEFSTFDAREEDARRGPLLLTAALAVFILFLGVVWSAYNQGLRESGRDGAPRLVPNEEPYRERPADPGGEETPDTDLEVYDRLTGDSTEVDEPVSLRPAPEEPIEDTRPALRVETVDADETGEEVTPRPAPERPRPESRVETPVDRTPAPQPEPARAEPGSGNARHAGTDRRSGQGCRHVRRMGGSDRVLPQRVRCRGGLAGLPFALRRHRLGTGPRCGERRDRQSRHLSPPAHRGFHDP